MTEDEAKQKWCPFARTAFSWTERPVLKQCGPGAMMGEAVLATATVNRAPSMADPCNCLASGCMAWRWGCGDDGYCGLAEGPKC